MQQLGSIYERLLEREVVRQDGNIVVRPNVFARKDSGSYYTPDDLVDLIVRESVGPLADARMKRFAAKAEETASDKMPGGPPLWSPEADRPGGEAAGTEGLRSGDGFRDTSSSTSWTTSPTALSRAWPRAEALVEGYLSPLVERIDGIRNTIMDNAEDRGWTFDPAQLDDRAHRPPNGAEALHLRSGQEPDGGGTWPRSRCGSTRSPSVPRLVFWTITSACGDSLFGAWVEPVLRRTDEKSSLFPEGTARAGHARGRAHGDHRGVERTPRSRRQHRSADIFAEVSEMTAPLHAFMSLLHAFDWLGIRKGAAKAAFLNMAGLVCSATRWP